MEEEIKELLFMLMKLEIEIEEATNTVTQLKRKHSDLLDQKDRLVWRYRRR